MGLRGKVTLLKRQREDGRWAGTTQSMQWLPDYLLDEETVTAMVRLWGSYQYV